MLFSYLVTQKCYWVDPYGLENNIQFLSFYHWDDHIINQPNWDSLRVKMELLIITLGSQVLLRTYD
jgi:hypothetical protein